MDLLLPRRYLGAQSVDVGEAGYVTLNEKRLPVRIAGVEFFDDALAILSIPIVEEVSIS